MQPNVIKHYIFEHKCWKRKTLLMLLRNKVLRKSFYQRHLRTFWYELVRESSPIPQKSLKEVIDFSEKMTFENFFSRNGNLSSFELMCITALASHRRPMRVLEIGTFDGNTTLQLALNTPEDAIIHTIDLPQEQIQTHEPVLDSDLQYITDEQKHQRKFAGTSVHHKVQQHFGDSTNYNFEKFVIDGPLDFIFIDGGHSYHCVKSDTKNALSVLSEGGCILWHDFTPHFGGVYQYLCELAQEYPLIHLEETNLVLFFNSAKV